MGDRAAYPSLKRDDATVTMLQGSPCMCDVCHKRKTSQDMLGLGVHSLLLPGTNAPGAPRCLRECPQDAWT